MRKYVQQVVIIVDKISRDHTRKRKRSHLSRPYHMIQRIPSQVKHLHRMVGTTDIDCIVNLRMDRNTIGRLCYLLRQLGGLSDGKYVSVEEQVAVFVSVLAHHKKNSIIGFDFLRSGQTISHYVHVVLRAIIMLHDKFLVKPKPIPEDCADQRWMWFKVLFDFFKVVFTINRRAKVLLCLF